MIWKDKNTCVSLAEKTYEAGIKVEKRVMESYEKIIERPKGIEKWFVENKP